MLPIYITLTMSSLTSGDVSLVITLTLRSPAPIGVWPFGS
jgi:hypothetical protein